MNMQVLLGMLQHLKRFCACEGFQKIANLAFQFGGKVCLYFG
jgi:hypothetical protein